MVLLNVLIMFVHLFINSHLDKPLGICPVEFRFKCGAGANTKATNKTNKQISDNTNQLNYKLWQEQKEYDYQKWQEYNAYNTPVEQRKRYEEAGLNPNLIAQQIGSGSSESPASAGTAPEMVAAQMQNPSDEISSYANILNNIAGGFNNMADTFSQNQLRSAQARESSTDADIKQVELTYRSAQLEAYINGLKKKGLLDDEQAHNLRIKNEVDEASVEADKARRRYEADNAEKTGRVLDSQAALNLAVQTKTEVEKKLLDKELGWYDRKARLEVSKMASEIAVNYANAALAGSQKDLVEAQTRTEVENRLRVIAETNHLNVSANQISRTTDDIVIQARYAAKSAIRDYNESQDNIAKAARQTGRVIDALSPIKIGFK